MDSFLLFSILVLVAIVVLLMLTLVDQIKAVHKVIAPAHDAVDEGPVDEIKEAAADIVAAQNDKADESFGKLMGKRLWDAMTGKPLPDIDTDKVKEVRPRYQVILSKHIEELFALGAAHGKANTPKPAANRRTIHGLLGTVVSWMPQQHADAIYQAGFDSVSANDEAARDKVRTTVAETANTLFGPTDLEPKGVALAASLVPSADATGPASVPAAAGDNILEGLSEEEALLLGAEGVSPAPALAGQAKSQPEKQAAL